MNTSLGHIFDSPVEPDSGSALPNAINRQHEPAIFVSVIVPVYNDPQGLRRCLAQLEQQTYPRDRFEVIVVDNDSDPVAEIQGVVAQFAQARYVYEAVPGSYAARNRGIQVARGRRSPLPMPTACPSPIGLPRVLPCSAAIPVAVWWREKLRCG
ncbi:MAG: glycosyltransferase family 2 protein [Synechococcales cyanobacterium CRU_2_2]|nr:glycosyltransferase family 2 protein [Synechococcales cyanobacterium CRU_2_2]